MFTLILVTHTFVFGTVLGLDGERRPDTDKPTTISSAEMTLGRFADEGACGRAADKFKNLDLPEMKIVYDAHCIEGMEQPAK